MVSVRATMQQQHLASARNRRLAQQMENRPSVQAALHYKQVSHYSTFMNLHEMLVQPNSDCRVY